MLATLNRVGRHPCLCTQGHDNQHGLVVGREHQRLDHIRFRQVSGTRQQLRLQQVQRCQVRGQTALPALAERPLTASLGVLLPGHECTRWCVPHLEPIVINVSLQLDICEWWQRLCGNASPGNTTPGNSTCPGATDPMAVHQGHQIAGSVGAMTPLSKYVSDLDAM